MAFWPSRQDAIMAEYYAAPRVRSGNLTALTGWSLLVDRWIMITGWSISLVLYKIIE